MPTRLLAFFCVFFRSFRLYSPGFFRSFLSERQEVAPGQGEYRLRPWLGPWKMPLGVENKPWAVGNETEEAGIEGKDTSDEAEEASSVA